MVVQSKEGNKPPNTARSSSGSETVSRARTPAQFENALQPAPIRRQRRNAVSIEDAPVRNLFPEMIEPPRDLRQRFLDLRSVRSSLRQRLRALRTETFDLLTETLSFRETCDRLAAWNLDQHSEFVKETMLRYSINIRGFPDCPDEDLMLAVYFYFEENFKINAKLVLTVRYDYKDEDNLVGVVFDSIQTKNVILEKAASLKRSRIKITCNVTISWILDGFCGE